jgi:hypothetical protein
MLLIQIARNVHLAFSSRAHIPFLTPISKKYLQDVEMRSQHRGHMLDLPVFAILLCN